MGEIASPKQTGQGGTSYEDKVNAYFIACLLTETPPFAQKWGQIKKIEFQTRADGWLFDDVLLTLELNNTTKRIAVSIKSSRQFNSNGCPSEINHLLWSQYLHCESTVFNSDTDLLCLLEPPVATSVSADLNAILAQAHEQEPIVFQRRNEVDGYNSKKKRRIYDSFSCPPSLASQYKVPANNNKSIIHCFLHNEKDFENVHSVSEIRTIEICQLSLVDKGHVNASRLFDKLVAISREMDTVGGFLNLEKVVALLVDEFDLAEFPSYLSDWKKLQDFSQSKIETIPDKLGSIVSLNRDATIAEITKALAKSHVCFVQGIPGGGKTTTVKLFVNDKKEKNKVIWFDSSDFEDISIEANIGLQHSFLEIINNTQSISYIILDGVEKLSQNSLKKRFFSVLHAITKEESLWRAILTYPADNLDLVLKMLSENNVNISSFDPVNITSISDDDVALLNEQFPQIGKFLFDDKLRAILNNLKLLDNLLRNIERIGSIRDEQNLGESHLIDFVWSNQIEKSENGIQKSSFLKLLGEKQADKLSLRISISEFSIADLTPVQGLINLSFLKHRDEHFSFVHDLYGDWARYKLLIANSADIERFIGTKPLSSLLWARAFRLYGISLLEKNSSSAKWKKTFDQFDDKSSQHIIVQDLLLESLFFSPNALSLLYANKIVLFENNGELFKRMLKLFLIRATSLNPQMLRLAKEIEGVSETTISAYDRLPIIVYWPDMISFLHENIDAVIGIDCLLVSKFAAIWLKKIPEGLPFRKETSDIALKAAAYIFTEKQKGRYIDDEISKPVYEAMLFGYPENTKEAAKLCLQLCRRITIDPVEQYATEGSQRPTLIPDKSILGMTGYPKREKKAWEDGPLAGVDDDFRQICIETQAIFKLYYHNPGLGNEIMLAILINEPNESYYGIHPYEVECEIYEPLSWYPPFFYRGPFLTMLKVNPVEGINFVVKLTNFVTLRWHEHIMAVSKSKSHIDIQVNGESKTLLGNYDVYFWNKGATGVPHLVVSVLMAFEQFLYENIEEGRPVERYVDFAISSTNSIAIVGLLMTVAKSCPGLFLRELKHLLPIYEFYVWENYYPSHATFYGWESLPKAWDEQVRKWKGRRVRYFPLKDFLTHLCTIGGEFRPLFNPIIKTWQEELNQIHASGEENIFLLQMIPQFDIGNYTKIEKGNNTYFEYNEPADVEERLKKDREEITDTLDGSTLAFQYTQLIKNNSIISIAEVEGHWDKIERLIKRIEQLNNVSEADFDGWSSPYTNVLSGMAMLIHFRSVWLALHPEYLASIKVFCLDVVDKRLRLQFEPDGYGTDFDWNIFLAKIIPFIWHQNNTDVENRKMIGALCIYFNAKTIQRLFESISELISWKDSRFIPLQNLLLLYAAGFNNAIKNRLTRNENIGMLRTELLSAFVNGSVESNAMLKWASIRTDEEWEIKNTRFSIGRTEEDDYMRRPGFHTLFIKAILMSLPDISETFDEQEKLYVLDIWSQAFDLLVYQLGAITDASRAISSYPHEFELFVLKKVPGFILILEEDKLSEKFWQPLFEFGFIAPQWIEKYCANFFLENLLFKERHERMAFELEKMLQFVASCDTWKSKHINRSGDFRLSVVGMQPNILSIWTDDYSDFMLKAESTYKKWFLTKKLNPFAVMSLLDFVTTKSGEFMLKEALVIFNVFFGIGLLHAQTPAPKGMTFVGHPEHDNALAKTLGELWEKNKEKIRRDEPLFNLYKELVQYLVAIKNEAGVELQNKLITE